MTDASNPEGPVPPPPARRGSTRDLAAGDVIANRFELESVLGRGAMGEVWAAKHLTLGLPCAVKFLSLDPRFSALNLDGRFEVEAQTTARLSSKTQHIVRVMDYGHHDGAPFLVMERLEGETLEARVERCGALDVATTLVMVEQIATALRIAHAEKLVHRDLKSANVFVGLDELGAPLVKVLDFGLVRALGVQNDSRASIGLILGSPHSMSPEQAAGQEIDERADVWAFATVAYEMLAGVSAFEGSVALEVVSHVVRCDFVPIEKRSARLARFSSLFARAFSPALKDRFVSVDDFLSALRESAESAATEALPTSDEGALAAALPMSAPANALPTTDATASVDLSAASDDDIDQAPAPRKPRWFPVFVVVASAAAIVAAAVSEARSPATDASSPSEVPTVSTSLPTGAASPSSDSSKEAGIAITTSAAITTAEARALALGSARSPTAALSARMAVPQPLHAPAPRQAPTPAVPRPLPADSARASASSTGPTIPPASAAPSATVRTPDPDPAVPPAPERLPGDASSVL